MTGPWERVPTTTYGWWWAPTVPVDPALVSNVPSPTVEDIRAWCEIGPAITDGQLSAVLAAETELQAARLNPRPDNYPTEMPSSLAQALLRRCARELAARGVPLGVTGADEYGPVVLPSFDTEIERLEAPWRDIPVG